jgi:hypothetical protein
VAEVDAGVDARVADLAGSLQSRQARGSAGASGS